MKEIMKTITNVLTIIFLLSIILVHILDVNYVQNNLIFIIAIDAIGDIVIVLTNLAALEKLDIEECINSAYNVIKKRTGSMIGGSFVKDK